MAAGAAVAGDAGRYVWTPIGAGLLVWGTFALTAAAAPPAPERAIDGIKDDIATVKGSHRG